MTVFLVGAGPGDPGLLTVRAAEALAAADVVVYDRLSVASLLDLAPPSAERINVGKAPGHVTLPQDDINRLLVERGRGGATVVRLKGGDPFVFARGGEEAAALLQAGVPFGVVPGITSALAVPAYAGIPVTMRHSSTSFTVVTGHEDPSAPEAHAVDWDAVARVGGTIVILMGVARWPAIAERLLAGGLGPDTPAAAVQWGTRPEQRSVRATLATLGAHELASPSVIVVGEVAGHDLAWFESRPLFGRKVVVTRAREQASTLSASLRGLGATVVELPTIEIVEPADGGEALHGAVHEVSMLRYEWVVFTSANAVRRFFAEVPDSRVLGGVRVAAVGSATAAVLRSYRVVADLVPTAFDDASLLDAFPDPPAAGSRRVLFPRAAVASDVLPDGLRSRGWEVEVVDAYRTLPVAPSDPLRAAASGADAITFTSSSTVSNYVAAVGTDDLPPVVVSIGPVTTATARQLGIDVTLQASEATVAGLVDAVRQVIGR